MINVEVTARQPGLSAIAFITFVLATCFPYIVAGPVVGWIATGLLCFTMAAMRGKMQLALQTQRGAQAFTLSWLALVIVTLVLDLVAYENRNVLAGSILNLFALMIFIGVFVAALRSDGRSIIQTIVIITLIQSIFAILQFLGSTWAWDFGSTLIEWVPGQSQDAGQQIYSANVAFEDVGRVRGTHLFVHIFNAVQSALVGVCVFMALNPDERELPSGRLRHSVRIAAIIGATALLLSFSRSGMLSLAGALLVTLLIQRSLNKIVTLAIVGLGAAALLYVLDFSNAAQFGRLTVAETDDTNVQTRLEHMKFAWDNFISSPLAGTSVIPNSVTLELPIHSVPFRILNDYGLLGFLPYAITFALIVMMSLNHVRSMQPQRIFWGGASLCLAFIMLAESGTHSSGFMRRDIVHGILFGLLIGQASRAAMLARLKHGNRGTNSGARAFSNTEIA